MDKNTYESYEYLQDNEDNEENQLIVVQEDGTILTVNRPIQYLTQVQDVKEVLDDAQSNIAYDVSQQQFYVNVDNSSELISVSDQFIIPESENNMYANSFLIQAVENGKDDKMEQDIPVELNTESENNVEVNVEENAENKMNGDCTEITLSDDQYQLLEQKGWILLETADKIYLLDTLGLHDITADKKLIEKLRYESQIDANEESSINITQDEEINFENNETNEGNFNTQVEEETDYVIEDGVEQQTEEVSYIDNEQESQVENDSIATEHFPHDYVKLNSVKDTSYRREGEALRIKTKFSFKDIPPEIVLGRTVNGKKLIASVKTEKHRLRSALTNKAVGDKFQRVSDEESEEHLQNDTGLNEAKFDALLQENLWGNSDNCSKKDVTAAEIVVEQLLRVPAFKPTIIERRLLVTKVVIEEHKTDEIYTETVPTLVTGRVMRKDSKLYFVYIPDLLRRSLRYVQGGKKVNEDYLHIHIREMKGADGITRISITLNKRHIPMATLANKARNKQKMAFACSACAAIYKTEEGLKLHQETECMEIDDIKIEAEADNSNNSFSVVLAGNDNQYMCNQCHSVFTKLSDCQNHIKTHYNQANAIQMEKSDKKEIRKIDGVYKCNMCPSTYLHAATLSKHIVTKHIKMKSN